MARSLQPAQILQHIAVRPFTADDQPFLQAVAHRMNPGKTVSPRDPDAVDRFFANLTESRLLSEPGAAAFVATVDGNAAGIVALHPDSDYFTGHPRAYVDILVVAPDAEGLGVGRALMREAETWARQQGCVEVVLDVFVGNDGAIAFYERCGYRPDHIRMAKPLGTMPDPPRR